MWGGCAPEGAPPAPTLHAPAAANSTSTPPSVAEKKPAVVTVKKPVSDPDKQLVEESPSVRTTDDFGLPLVIVIKVPEVPAEIRGPSPPIREASGAAPKP
ncbi:MAG: hypothetical protein K8R46_12480 [Pirellulales bacterium]|nr:hypothetical protein [Pirellulales bacterium]